MASHRPSPILLRAEMRSARETVVSYTRELTPTSVFVVTDWRPPVATPVTLRLSLPTLVDPTDIEARVYEHRPAQGVGRPAGLEFHFDSSIAREAMEKLMDRVGLGP